MENRTEMPEATELEFLTFFCQQADFGPADEDVRYSIEKRFEKKTGRKVPNEWSLREFYEDET